jgi:hypothetical protein
MVVVLIASTMAELWGGTLIYFLDPVKNTAREMIMALSND